MSGVRHSLYRLGGEILTRHLAYIAERPEASQRALLSQILRTNADTEFGREHGFSKIGSESEFRRRIPIREFESFRPYIDRIARGEPNILTRRNPVAFGRTSGTSGGRKLMPLTKDYVNLELQRSAIWFSGILKDHPQALKHGWFAIGGRPRADTTPSGLAIGVPSGAVLERAPGGIRSRFAIPTLIPYVREFNERYFTAMRLALEKRISIMTTTIPSTFTRLFDTIEDRRADLLRAIHDGVLGTSWCDDPEVIRKLSRGLRPNPDRARELERIANRTGRLRPTDCWPDLKLVCCWLGGTVGLQARKLREMLGDQVPLRDLGYLACEGHYSIPLEDESPSGILDLHSHYFEFIREEDEERPDPPIHSAADLEVGGRYLMISSGLTGLIRYDIRDVVEATGRWRRTPMIAFLRKSSEIADISGEKAHVQYFLDLVGKVAPRLKIPIEAFRVTPNRADARYEMHVEFTTPVGRETVRDRLLPELDRELRELFPTYNTMRNSRRLGSLRLHVMRKGWAEEDRRRSVEGGIPDAQYKWKHLEQERSAEDEAAIEATHELGLEDAVDLDLSL
jgi:hypothetical protein